MKQIMLRLAYKYILNHEDSVSVSIMVLKDKYGLRSRKENSKRAGGRVVKIFRIACLDEKGLAEALWKIERFHP